MKGRRGLLLPKACVVGFAALLAAWAPRAGVVGASADLSALALSLGEAVSAKVERDEIVWAPSSGALGDYLFGRVVLFAASPGHEGPRDVFATCARVLPDGRVRSVGTPANITESPHEDDAHLLSNGTHAAFVITGEQVVATRLVRFASALLACSVPPYSLKVLDQYRVSFRLQVEEVTAQLLPHELRLKAGDGPALELPLTPFPARSEEVVELPGTREKAVLKALGIPVLLSDPRAKARVWKRTEQTGAIKVELTTIDAQTFRWRILPGISEPFPGERVNLTPSEQARVAVVITLGRTSVGTRYGLGASGNTYLPFRVSYPTLKITDGRRFGLLPAGTRPELSPNEELVQLPLVVSFGEPTAMARSHGTLRERGALCAQPGGSLLLAHTHQDSSLALAQVLANARCSAAFDLDRGSQDHARVFLRGSGTPPAFPYEVSVLVGSD
ncbi:MAG: hypothetical protein SFV15_20020 [Polyangiaceae bacterium]|nr:hypothetical protein [Polyangiaceae bacterium]